MLIEPESDVEMTRLRCRHSKVHLSINVNVSVSPKRDPLCKVNSQEDNASLARACNTGEGGREGDGAVQSIPWATEKKKDSRTVRLFDVTGC